MRTIFQLYLTSFLSLKICVTRSVISSLRSYFANWPNIDRKWPLNDHDSMFLERSEINLLNDLEGAFFQFFIRLSFFAILSSIAGLIAIIDFLRRQCR